jgi:hypothetical protein
MFEADKDLVYLDYGAVTIVEKVCKTTSVPGVVMTISPNKDDKAPPDTFMN